MKLLFKQRFTWGFDRYEIYNEAGETVFTIKGKFAFGRQYEIYDRADNFIGALVGKVFTFMPTFELYIGENFVGTVKKKVTFFKPEFILDCNGWTVGGNWLEHEYSILDSLGVTVATLSKSFTWMDEYILDIVNDADALTVLMIVLAIDSEKDSRN